MEHARFPGAQNGEFDAAFPPALATQLLLHAASGERADGLARGYVFAGLLNTTKEAFGAQSFLCLKTLLDLLPELQRNDHNRLPANPECFE